MSNINYMHIVKCAQCDSEELKDHHVVIWIYNISKYCPECHHRPEPKTTSIHFCSTSCAEQWVNIHGLVNNKEIGT